jgi:preprotein translocase subunit SecF
MKFFSLFDPKSEFDFIGKLPVTTKIGFLVPVVSIVSILVLGIPWGLDFQGGTEMQVKFDKPITTGEVRDLLTSINFEKSQIQRYGADETNELLIRVERITSITDENIKRVDSVLKERFESDLRLGAQKDASAVLVEFKLEDGDRMTITLPEPVRAPNITDEEAIAPNAGQRALEAQEAALSKILDESSGLKLRRTKRTGEAEANIDDAITRDEPYQATVKYLVHFRGVSADIERALHDKFGGAEIRRVDFVDATVAKQLQTDGAFAVLIALLFILLYVAIRFDIFFSPGAVLALAHDALGAILVFTIFRVEFDLPSVAALLTVVGYSINNTIVIYDRVRETLPNDPAKPLTEDQVKGFLNKAINDTWSRTVNTTLTTLMACIALAVFGTSVVRNFAIVLMVGFSFGAFTSVFLAPGIYLFFRRNFHNQEAVVASSTSGLTREDKARGVV